MKKFVLEHLWTTASALKSFWVRKFFVMKINAEPNYDVTEILLNLVLRWLAWLI